MNRPLGQPQGTHGNPGEMERCWYFFFPHGAGELFSFGIIFAGPRGHTHGICSSFGRRYIALDQSFSRHFIVDIHNSSYGKAICY